MSARSREKRRIVRVRGAPSSTKSRAILTREMLDDHSTISGSPAFGTIFALTRPSANRPLPYILKWAEAGAKLSGVRLVRGFNATWRFRAAAENFRRLDYVISRLSRRVEIAADSPRPAEYPDRPFEAHLPTNTTKQHRVPGTWRKIRRSRSTAGMTPRALPIGVRSSARRFDDIGVTRSWPRKSLRACAARNSRCPEGSWLFLLQFSGARGGSDDPESSDSSTVHFITVFRVVSSNTHRPRNANKKNRNERPLPTTRITYEVADQIAHLTFEPTLQAQRLQLPLCSANYEAFDGRRQGRTTIPLYTSPAAAAASAHALTSVLRRCLTFDQATRARKPVQAWPTAASILRDPILRDGGGQSATTTHLNCLNP